MSPVSTACSTIDVDTEVVRQVFLERVARGLGRVTARPTTPDLCSNSEHLHTSLALHLKPFGSKIDIGSADAASGTCSVDVLANLVAGLYTYIRCTRSAPCHAPAFGTSTARRTARVAVCAARRPLLAPSYDLWSPLR
jgi:hypothetical protein